MSDSEQWDDGDGDPRGGRDGEPRLADHLTSRETWLRALFMLLFVLLWGVSRIVVGFTVIVQFAWVLLTGQTSARLAELGQGLATYTYQIVLYLTYNTEERPFPFSDWPQGPPSQSRVM